MKLSEINTKLVDFEFTILKDGFFEYFSLLDSIKNDVGAIVYVSNSDLIWLAFNKNITSIIVNDEIDFTVLPKNVGILICKNPKRSFYVLHNLVSKSTYRARLKPTFIASSAKIASTAIIDDYGVEIGENSVVGEFSVLSGSIKIGNNVEIGNNVSIGSNGFQYYRDNDGVYQVFSYGSVVIEDFCSIKNSISVDRGVFSGTTRIGSNVKIDNLVHIGHDCNIGENSIIVTGTSIGGRTVVGKSVWIGMGSTISNNIHIGDFSEILIGSVVAGSILSKSRISGYFASNHESNLISQIKLKRLK